MRNLIRIIEGRGKLSRTRATAKPMDLTPFVSDMQMIMAKLKAGPFAFRFNRELTDKIRAVIDRRKAEYAGYAPEDDMGVFGMEDLRDAFVGFWSKEHRYLFGQVRSEAEHAIHEYQERAAERHDRLDDPDFYIEDSDFLRAVHEEVTLASWLDSQDVLSTAFLTEFCRRMNRFIDDWKQYEHPSDGGEAPMLGENFVNDMQKVVPFFLLATLSIK